MRHFIVYHKADDRGQLDRTEQYETEAIVSKKSLKILQTAIGNRVWLFEGCGTTTRNPVFSLAYSFLAEAAEGASAGKENRLSGSSVVYFENEALNDLPWFRKLKIEMANFSLGFQEVRNPEIIAQLEAYLAEEYNTNSNESLPSMFTEGGRKRTEISIRQRSQSARLACIRHYGTACFVCGFDFGQFYGERAKGFIEVHHRKQISESNGSRNIDAVSDLVPLCANCHRAMHLSNPPMDVELLREQIQRRPNQTP
ncbi:MAG: HNH endonuclease [Verrucomicrobiota bacterium]